MSHRRSRNRGLSASHHHSQSGELVNKFFDAILYFATVSQQFVIKYLFITSLKEKKNPLKFSFLSTYGFVLVAQLVVVLN